MLLAVFAIIVGFVLLIWGADRFIHGAANLARNLGVPPMIIGLTVISICTSAPEMLLSAFAALEGNRDMGIGNAVGSNIANIGLVLGCTAIVTPLAVRSATLKREVPLMFLVMFLALALMTDGRLSRMDGGILVVGLALVLWWLTRLGMNERRDPLAGEVMAAVNQQTKVALSILWLLFGFTLLLAGARITVWGAVTVAQAFGVSDLVIGLTIIAIGTSLPELVASIVGALKGEADLVLGNVIGSNIFNILAVLSLPALIHPGVFADPVLWRDLPVMFVFTMALLLFAFRPHGINRWKGGILAGAYVAYLYLLYLQA